MKFKIVGNGCFLDNGKNHYRNIRVLAKDQNGKWVESNGLGILDNVEEVVKAAKEFVK